MSPATCPPCPRYVQSAPAGSAASRCRMGGLHGCLVTSDTRRLARRQRDAAEPAGGTPAFRRVTAARFFAALRRQHRHVAMLPQRAGGKILADLATAKPLDGRAFLFAAGEEDDRLR